MNPISAIMVVKNNPPHTIETIESLLGFVEEIIIADIGIDPLLKNNLKELPLVRFIDKSNDTPYVELIREELKQEARGKFVLFLDPDEVLTPNLKHELQKHLLESDYFSIPRKNIIFGKWIQHSRWWPDYQIRLFKKNSVVWPREIHKQPVVTGKEYKIAEQEPLAIIHYNYESIDEYLAKAMRYAKAEANTSIMNKEIPTLSDSMKKAISEFISRFFAGEGYKDGIHGFMLAIFQMFYPLIVYFYYLEKTKYLTNITEEQLCKETTRMFGKLHKESLFWKNKKESTTLREKIIEKIIL